jgi:hypothetical protein
MGLSSGNQKQYSAFYWAEDLEFIIDKAWKEQYKIYMNLLINDVLRVITNFVLFPGTVSAVRINEIMKSSTYR